MNPATLKRAVDEAKRFLAVAKAIEVAKDRKPDDYFFPSKETAAAKRASMDLTRALADMRRVM
jgi:hypothetical protein